MTYVDQQMSDSILGTYVGTASGGNVKVYRKYTVKGEGVYLKCSKCAAVLILNELAGQDYSKKGILEKDVQDYVNLHKHPLEWEVKKPVTKMSPGKIMGEYDGFMTSNYVYNTLLKSPRTSLIKAASPVPDIVEPVKKTGRRFR